MSKKIKKGDLVSVLSGKDRGKTGKVTRILSKRSRAYVEGINLVKKHNKPSQNNKGGIETIEMSIHISKLSILDPKTNKPSRVGFKFLEDGKKVRFLKKSGETLG